MPNKNKIQCLQEKIEYLKSKPQPEQRTPEWYKFRHTLITASNAYKAFENQTVQNQLIYEKCQPLPTFDNISDTDTTKSEFVNVSTPMHWGQKYEPVSVEIYEQDYNTEIGDFGCIQHDKYSFIGASPDGINVDPERPARYGRMLEIKNIVNREIDGIPKKEYWVQMQLQMETCDLDECDFLETRFQEYEDYGSFLEDGSFTKTSDYDWKGVIMYFSTNEGRPHYIYKPLTMEKWEFEKWSEDNMDKFGSTETWIKNIYWKADEVSCVLVQRNTKWFQDNISGLETLWNTVLKERESGFTHRAPNRRTSSSSKTTNDITNNNNKIEDYYDLGSIKKRTLLEKNGCLIKFNKNT